MNLAQALGGSITTTGANRCRMDLQNIYAYLAMENPQSTQNQCQKATVTFHGGGHREKPSQNNDKGAAPSYLIQQFRSAFERAGFTPKSLGLDISQTKPLNCTNK